MYPITEIACVLLVPPKRVCVLFQTQLADLTSTSKNVRSTWTTAYVLLNNVLEIRGFRRTLAVIGIVISNMGKLNVDRLESQLVLIPLVPNLPVG